MDLVIVFVVFVLKKGFKIIFLGLVVFKMIFFKSVFGFCVECIFLFCVFFNFLLLM